MSILIKVSHRALHKAGQAKALEDVRVPDLHPTVKYNDYFIANVFGVFDKGRVKILKSNDATFPVGSIFTIQEINDFVTLASTGHATTTTSPRDVIFHF